MNKFHTGQYRKYITILPLFKCESKKSTNIAFTFTNIGKVVHFCSASQDSRHPESRRHSRISRELENFHCKPRKNFLNCVHSWTLVIKGLKITLRTQMLQKRFHITKKENHRCSVFFDFLIPPNLSLRNSTTR